METSGRVKQVLKFAEEEAKALGHNVVGTHHVLLGLLREVNGVGSIVLRELMKHPELVKGDALDFARSEVSALVMKSEAKPKKAEPSAQKAEHKVVKCFHCGFSSGNHALNCVTMRLLDNG